MLQLAMVAKLISLMPCRKASKAAAKAAEDAQHTATLLFARALPGLITTYQTEPVQVWSIPASIPATPVEQASRTSDCEQRFLFTWLSSCAQAAALAGILGELQMEVWALKSEEQVLGSLLQQV